MTRMTAKEFDQLRERDQHCLHCGRDDDTLVPNHRANRGHGGSKLLERPSNVVLLCSEFNGLIESNARAADLAKANGWKLMSFQNPTDFPVHDAFLNVSFWLDDDYERTEVTP